MGSILRNAREIMGYYAKQSTASKAKQAMENGIDTFWLFYCDFFGGKGTAREIVLRLPDYLYQMTEYDEDFFLCELILFLSIFLLILLFFFRHRDRLWI